MGHAVHYTDASGGSRFELLGSLDAALALVERLRNDEETADVRVFREVPIEVKTYYKVAVAEDAPADAPPAPPTDAPVGDVPAATATDAPAADVGDADVTDAPAADVSDLDVTADLDVAEVDAAEVDAGEVDVADLPAPEPVLAAAPDPEPRSVPEPLSGAVVMSPPPVTLHPEAAELDDIEPAHEPRRPLFSRG